MATPHRRLIMFVQSPVPGPVKERLIPELGKDAAAELYRRLLLRTFRAAVNACANTDIRLEIRFEGGDARLFHNWLGDGFLCRPQCEGDQGQRLSNAFKDSFREGSVGTLIIDSDCPEMTSARIKEAFERLALASAVFGQAYDGGYYLIGLTKLIPELFEGIAWGTESVLSESKKKLAVWRTMPAILEPIRNLNVPEDLADWRRLIAPEEGFPQRVSVIIPTLNDAENLAATLDAIRSSNPHEILVVDAGSNDEAVRIAQDNGARVLQSKLGRAQQMNTGAAMATGNVLLFLHPDTLLPENWAFHVQEALSGNGVVAGAFTLRIAGAFRGRRMAERSANSRSLRRQQPHGEQGLFLRRELFEAMGGFADVPVLEDYEFNQRLQKRGQIVTSPASIQNPGMRWQRKGAISTMLVNKLARIGYHLGMSPQTLAGFYRQ